MDQRTMESVRRVGGGIVENDAASRLVEELAGTARAAAPEALVEVDPPVERLELSVVAPVLDEEPNLRALVDRVCRTLGNEHAWEFLLIDDGSRNGSAKLIRELSGGDRRIRGVYFARHCGQTTALKVGIALARAPLIVTLDADLQNVPDDIPLLVAALGVHDAVVGWRARRADSLMRRMSSAVAKALRNAVLGDAIRDTGCSLKLFRAEAVRSIPLFEGMHRFLPTLLRYHGFSVIEHPVSHHPRMAGRSKYGISNRLGTAFLDLLAVRWMRARIVHPPILRNDSGTDRRP